MHCSKLFMNNRIYFNNHYIEILSADNQPTEHDLKTYVLDKQGGKKLTAVLKEFTQGSVAASLRLICTDTEDILRRIREHFTYIEAAGGLIEKNGKHLFIFRHGLWDLPKGKLEKGEKSGPGAIRECEEECGISGLSIIKEIGSTYHIYSYKGAFALKRTYWYYMSTGFDGILKPQTEENITEVKWFSATEIRDTVLTNTYHTIRLVLSEVPGI